MADLNFSNCITDAATQTVKATVGLFKRTAELLSFFSHSHTYTLFGV